MSAKINVLLVDDDEDDFILIRGLLSEVPRTEFHVTWKQTYESAVDSLAHGNYDVCLLDYRLGEHTGMDLLRESQRQGYRFPMILLTGHGDLQIDLEAMATGAADYLVKSQINAPLLERSIRYSIKRHQDTLQILQQDRLASLGLLASSLAHEIGTPLGVMRGRAEMLQNRYAQDPKIQNDMGIIISQVDRVAKLVNSLLHLARGENSASAAATEIKIADSVTEVLNLIGHELERHSIKVSVDIPSNLVARAVSSHLGQVLLNLLVNAVHAIESAKKNGRQTNHQVSLRAVDMQNQIALDVQDSGCGISEVNLQQIFKPFFSTKPVGMGTGLGLATSYQLVKSWGGSIQVQSKEGVGTTFKILLPKRN